MQEISERLSKAIEQKKLKEKLERDLGLVEQELNDYSTRFEAISNQLEKEKVDVEILEHTNLTSLFYSVLGSREEQLEKERQEFLSVQLQYRQIKKQLMFLEQDRESLSQQLDRLIGIEAEYQELFDEKEQRIKQSDHPAAREIVEVAEQIAELDADIKEIGEAIEAGNQVVLGLEQVRKLLKSAENWGVWDILGGGMIASLIKHFKVDEAQIGIDIIQKKIAQFTRELADVQEQVDLRVEFSNFEYFADYFFDGLIFDWVVQSKITDSLWRVINTHNEIIRIIRGLENLKAQTQTKIKELLDKRTQLIESA
jgi:hypothetical protein